MTALLLALGLAWGDEPLSFVVFVADDQRADTLWAMDRVTTLAEEGAVFTRAYATTPLCCPSRASLLSGGHTSGATGVLSNVPPNGCTALFDPADTLATRFQAAGYATGLVGKYLNDYAEVVAPEIPPGWTRFSAVRTSPDWFHVEVVGGSSTPDAPSEGQPWSTDAYVTDWQRDAAVDFLEEHGGGDFLLLVPFVAPHPPRTPAPEDQGAFAAFEHRPPSWNEEDVSDKPAWVRATSPLEDVEAARLDREARDHLRCLLSVDRAVGEILDTLDDLGLRERTVVVYTSDNGTFWGEHRQTGKGRPYEEGARVPLVLHHPDHGPAGEVHALAAADLDVPATLLALAGLGGSTEGLDLSPWLAGAQPPWRDHLVLSNHGRETSPSWAAWVGERHKYVAYTSGEEELYDLVVDPWELESQHLHDPDLASSLAHSLADERPLDLLPSALPVGVVGEAVAFRFDAVGGTPPYSWSLEPTLPDLRLSTGGALVGTPTAAGAWTALVRVTDASTSPWTGEPQSVALVVEWVVDAAPAEALDPGCARCGGSGAWAVLLPLLGLGRRRYSGGRSSKRSK